jgi:hypothetical protein
VIALSLVACNGDRSNNSNNALNSNSNPNITAVVTPPDPPKPGDPDPSYKPCNPYFPLVPGSLARYNLIYSSGLTAAVTTVVESAERDGRRVLIEKEQIVDSGGGSMKLSNNTREFVCDGENVELISDKGDNKAEGYQATATTKFNDRAFVMVPPSDLTAGRTWSYNFVRTLQQATGPPITPSSMTRKLEFAGFETVTLPAGQFKAAKIKWTVKDKTGTDYYTRGIGLVKRVADDGTYWELKEYSGMKPLE